MKCDFANCPDPAVAKCGWGPHANQQATVCAKHGAELWKSCESRVNAGLIPWTNKAIEEA